MESYIFIYNSLRKGCPNNHIMDELNALYFASGFTIDNLLLVGSKNNDNPYLMDVNFGKNVYGDIYKININKLKILDEIEGYPLLCNRVEKIIFYNNCLCPKKKYIPIKCYIYIINDKDMIQNIIKNVNNTLDIIDSGDWKTYNS